MSTKTKPVTCKIINKKLFVLIIEAIRNTRALSASSDRQFLILPTMFPYNEKTCSLSGDVGCFQLPRQFFREFSPREFWSRNLSHESFTHFISFLYISSLFLYCLFISVVIYILFVCFIFSRSVFVTETFCCLLGVCRDYLRIGRCTLSVISSIFSFLTCSVLFIFSFVIFLRRSWIIAVSRFWSDQISAPRYVCTDVIDLLT